MIWRKCFYLLAVLYLICLAAGWWFFRYTMRAAPRPFADGDPRNRIVRVWRFSVYVLLMPVGMVCAIATLLVWAADAGLIPYF